MIRKPAPVDVMLLGTVLLWSLNTTVSKYVLEHGWQPLSYAVIRYGLAICLFWVFTWLRERSFRIARRDLKLVGVAAGMIFVNQLCFVYSLRFTTASTVALMFGSTPVWVGLVGVAAGFQRLGRRFWAAALVTIAGVAAIAAASGGVGGDLKGSLFALGGALTWGVYSLAVAPLMRRYSPFRISSVVLVLGWIPLAAAGAPQIAGQSFAFGGLTWTGFAYAVVGPLFLTNILWFTAIDRVGAAHATLFSNLQPFAAVVFAVLLLSERLHPLEIAGGVLILAGIVLDRIGFRPRLSRAPETPVE